MSEQKILNLDELATPAVKAISIGGVSYEMTEQSLQDFIDIAHLAEKIKTTDDQTAFVEFMVKRLTTLFPTCPESVIRGLTFPKIRRIFEFVVEDAEQTVAEAEAQGVKKK